MPTAAKLIAAIIFALTGFITAENVRPLLPEGTATGWLLPVSIIVPMICGWRVIGRLVGKNYAVAINSGFYAIAVSLFFTILTFSIGEMLRLSTRGAYDGPMHAITSMFGIAYDYGALMIDPNVIASLVFGAVVGGLAGEWAHRKWA